LPWFVLVGFLGGVGLSIYGVVGWARRQKIIDESEDIGLRREQVELLRLTDAEKSKKLDRDAAESIRDTAPAPEPGRQPDYATARAEIGTLESALAKRGYAFA
jgi:hypothetical protein